MIREKIEVDSSFLHLGIIMVAVLMLFGALPSDSASGQLNDVFDELGFENIKPSQNGGVNTSFENGSKQGSRTYATVTSVTDGDTVDIQFSNGSTDTIRLLGVDTPETYGRTTPEEFEGVPDNSTGRQCLADWGEKATKFAETNLKDKTVQIIFDPESSRRGSYGRLLNYIYYNSTQFNLQLIKQGYARVYESQFTNETIYLEAEKKAREQKKGLWSCTENNRETVLISYTQFDAPGDDQSNLNGEYVTIKNYNSSKISLEGWTLEDDDGHSFKFPDIKLESGENVSIHTGNGVDTDSDLYWGRDRPVWNNNGDQAYLKDNKGREVDTRPAYG